MEKMMEKKFPLDAKDYKLYEEVGEGVSASVYRALCVPFNEIVAIKVLDLEKCNNDLDGIRREVLTMSLIDHPNVLRAHCSFTTGHHLWVVMPYMAGGSCLHIIKSAHPDGFEEPVIATLLREVLNALVYLHGQGHIHRDVKAGNILIDTNGAVKLADFGVAACMFDTGDRQRSRNTFVGTPCWMAPEVMQQLHGYDFKADIWSLGITALELAHGHAPFSKYPPMKVLLMTLQNAPPGLDYERDKRFSKQEYIRGISAWNFNLEDLKNQAALIPDTDITNAEDQCMSPKQGAGLHDAFSPTERPSLDRPVPNSVGHMEDRLNDIHDLENSLAAFPMKPLRALKGCFDVCEDDSGAGSPCWKHAVQPEQFSQVQSSRKCKSQEVGRDDGESPGQSSSLTRSAIPGHKKLLSGSIMQDNVSSPKKVTGDGDREYMQPKYTSERNYSGPLQYRQKKDIINPTSGDDMSEGAVVQRKGRFKVTSADLSPRGPTNSFFGASSGGSTIPLSSSLTAVSILPSLQCILHQNSIQREEIMKLIKYVEQSGPTDFVEGGINDLLQVPPTTSREKELQSHVIQLQQSIGSLVEELQRQRLKNAQLEKKASALLKDEKT
ncbi:CBL-interacting protein kinase 8 isoform X2 [Coffea eugenioides]|uniref:CBL-interacting protein kinase 8 isoform X2 n=1 Tax=Coffea eugenioides TaxID=49369 RepID=UPI000F60BDCA|nr:CBL-interacting protein kinase 8 isoform X2 [Coffea eugenioides]